MTKQTINTNSPDDLINVGANANDRQGDSLRTAFIRLNDAVNLIDANFTELYAFTGADAAANQLVNGLQIVNLDSAGVVTFPSTGTIQQNRSETTTSSTDIPNSSSAVIHTANAAYTSYKLVITVEGILDGDLTGTQHTQTCEATIAAIYNSAVEPVISVYGVIYTSPTPLATFAVRRGLLNAIEVVAVNSQALETLHVSVHAVNVVSTYD